MAGPLSGVTVVEMAGIGPAPFACMVLADMGARIIRVDRKASAEGGTLAGFLSNDGVVGRGRTSIAVNLKDPRAAKIVLKLIERADVLVEGFRPGVMEKLGLGPEECIARNPKLVYGRMTGWGQAGPLAMMAGHDINYISLCGALNAMGSGDRPPLPPLNLVGDYGGGAMFLALGVVAALFEAGRSGNGQVVDAAMSDGTAVLMSLMYSLQTKGLWNSDRGSNFLDGASHFYGVYECADGKYVSVGSVEPQFYTALLTTIGIAESDQYGQWDADHWPEMKAKISAIFKSRSRDEWSQLFAGSDACFTSVLDLDEAPHHPHNVARQTFVESCGVVQPAPAPRFGRTVSELPPKAPDIGEDTIALLNECGYGSGEIASFLEDGLVQQLKQAATNR